MAIRVKHRVWVQAFEDVLAKNKLFAPDPELSEVVTDGFDKCFSGVISVAVAGNENLSLGDITAVKGLWLKIDGEALVKLNGSSDGLQLRLEPDGVAATDFAKLFFEGDVSAVNVANASAAVMSGVYFIWGDATP